MLHRVILAVFLVVANEGFAQELVMPEGDPRTRIAELERSAAALQGQVNSLQAQQAGSAEDCIVPYEGNDIPFTHVVVYDDGWTLRPVDANASPYELTFSFHDQFRYTGFVGDEPLVTNAAGQQIATPDRNSFDINRGRLVFSGYAIDPLVEFYVNIDYNTVSDRPIQLLMGWIRYPFNPAFNLAYGLGKVPGVWEWQESSRYTIGAERSLATTFFRPSITAGVWVDGEPFSGFHYAALIGDGFNTFTLNTSELDTNLVYSGMAWWEPWGSFGLGFSDIECHADPVIRFGNALTFSRQDADPANEPGPEQTVIRISDGTPLVTPGALGPGVTVNQFDLTLYTLHAGWKHRGASLSGEYFLRWLTDIRGDGTIPDSSIADHGFYIQGGTFVTPRSVELFMRGSAVFGPFGDGSEVGGGVNWYVRHNRNWRLTFDVARVDDSPAQRDRTGFLAGASGLLIRSQCWVFF
jgi:hypothetical protein